MDHDWIHNHHCQSGMFMALVLTISYMKRTTKAREDIYQLIQEVNASCTPVTITNTRGKNAVLIGEEDWKAIEETLYLMSIPGMTESIIEEGNTDISECLDGSEAAW